MTDVNISNGYLSNFDELASTNHDIELIKSIDSLLKCGICYEYFDTCVVTDCSHNFCSLCIRKYIQFKTECPVCFQELYDSQLRSNRVIDNMINIFPSLKDRIIRHLRTLKTLKPNCVYVSPPKSGHNSTPQKNLNARKRVVITPQNVFHEESESIKIAAADSDSNRTNDLVSAPNKVIIPKLFQSPVKKNSPSNESRSHKLVSCPVCQVEILERNINVHLDACLNRGKENERREQKSLKRNHLPKFVYRLMSLNVLRSKMKEYGLNAQGDFDTLKNRLQRYTALYNAECDKPDPRPVQEVIHQLEREEKTLSNQKLPKSIFAVSRDSISKDEFNEQYLKENKGSFQKLINDVKHRKPPQIIEKHFDNERAFSEKCYVSDCQPSTSKSCYNNSGYVDDTNDCIEIEEHDVKIEPLREVKEESIEELVDNDGHNENCCNENIVAASTTNNIVDDESDEGVCSILCESSRKRKRRLFYAESFDDFNESDDKCGDASSSRSSSQRVKFNADESDDGDYEKSTTSPILRKGNTRKRNKTEGSSKSPRKRRK